MSYPVFYVPSGDVLPIFFASYDGGTGASSATTGLAVTDIEIYKDGSVTQRASDAGYTLLDTDGLDFDGITGINGFSIDTGDNTDAGFYTVGAWFTVVVSTVTVDAQTVSFIAAQFRLMPAESVAGKPKVDTDTFGGTAGTFSGGRPEVNTTHAAGTAWGSGAITAASIASDAITDAKVAADVTIASVTGAVGSVTGNVGGNVAGSVGSVTARVTANTDQLAGQTVTAAAGVTFPTSVASPTNITAGTITTATNVTTVNGLAANVITAASINADAVTELQSGLSTLTTAQVNAEVDTALADVGLTTTITGRIDAAISTRATPAQILTTALTEAYAADGAAGTLSEILFGIQAFLHERDVAGTTLTVKKLDGSTSAMTFTLNDSTSPTSITRAT